MGHITDRWFGLVAGNLLQSDELELDRRTTVLGGAGRHLVQTNQWHFALVGGLAWMNENFFGSDRDKNNAEAVAGVELNGFNLGDVNILTRLVIYPSLTDSGRVRMDLKSDFKWDLPKDLYFSIGFTTNYDSSPPTDTPKNDYIFSSAVGWSH